MAGGGGDGDGEDTRAARPPARIPQTLPLLPVRDLVVFPYMIVPLRVSRPVSVAAVQKALATEGRLVMLAAQSDPEADTPGPDAIYRTGTVGMVMRMRKLSEGGLKILVQGLCRARVREFLSEKPSYRVRIQRVADPRVPPGVALEALVQSVRENIEKLAAYGKSMQPELAMVVQSVEDPGRIADLVASNLTLKVADAQAILELADPVARLERVNRDLEKELGILEVQTQIQSRAKEEMSKSQRDFYLREQMRQIRSELGDGDVQGDDLAELRARIGATGMPDEVRAEADKHVRRLSQMHADSAEAGVLRAYLEWLCDVPWRDASEDHLELAGARRVLDEDHYDLSEVKDRILDYLAVLKLRGGAGSGAVRGPILCFIGPPGVGKTSLGRSIARCLGRKFVRASLGGVRDEAEIRGHRRTYVGALPGRIIQGMKQAGTRNPVFLLDEIDKLGADYRGDPSAALLEVLDPEQNHAFRDHYLGVPYDLSHVLFIATANLPDGIPAPLRDRMEVLRLSGYSEEEKITIAERFLVPRLVAEAGLPGKGLTLPRVTLRRIIAEYTREAGLRELGRLIAQLGRKAARRVVEGAAGPQAVSAGDLPRWLGPPRFPESERRRADEIGVANGLAWTAHGGEVLSVEAQGIAGKAQLTLTGSLGDVMKESAQAAMSFTRAHALALGLEARLTADRDFHVHVPSGAIPKDGPSAGVTIACALVSLVEGVPIRHEVAMTGELTLRGRVLPIGGLKEKLLAAARAGMSTVVVPAGNLPELEDLPAPIRARLRIVPARTMADVLAAALVRPATRPPRRAPVTAAAAPGAPASVRRGTA